MKIFYSIKTSGFYSEENLTVYKEAGTLPDDLVEINEVDYNNYFNPPTGCGSIFDENGPRVENLPTPDYLSRAESQRQILLSEANITIADWRTDLQLDTISDEDKTSLVKWMAYIKALKGMEFSSVTDDGSYQSIAWPNKPVN